MDQVKGAVWFPVRSDKSCKHGIRSIDYFWTGFSNLSVRIDAFIHGLIPSIQVVHRGWMWGSTEHWSWLCFSPTSFWLSLVVWASMRYTECLIFHRMLFDRIKRNNLRFINARSITGWLGFLFADYISYSAYPYAALGPKHFRPCELVSLQVCISEPGMVVLRGKYWLSFPFCNELWQPSPDDPSLADPGTCTSVILSLLHQPVCSKHPLLVHTPRHYT